MHFSVLIYSLKGLIDDTSEDVYESVLQMVVEVLYRLNVDQQGTDDPRYL